MYIEELAAKHLNRFLRNLNKFSLRTYIYDLRLPTKTKKRLASLLFGIITYLHRIDWYLGQMHIDSRLRTKEMNLLRVFLYRLCIERNLEPLNRFDYIDGIDLKDLARKCDDFNSLIERLPHLDRLSIKYSFPKFFIRKLHKFFDKQNFEKFLRSLNSRLPYTWICINTAKYDVDEVLDILTEEGFLAHRDQDFFDLMRVEALPKKLEKSRAFRSGMFIIAEKASVATTHALEPKKGDIILDMATAPGIKLICTAFKMAEGTIYAIDISETRMKRLLKLTKKYLSDIPVHIKTFIGDSRKINYDSFSDINKILLDAECTSSGMIPKSPDIKLRITPDKIKKMSSLQKELLTSAFEMARNTYADLIVYSVCSFFPEEGEFVVMETLRHYDDLFFLDNLSFGAPSFLGNYGRRFFPHIHKTIGFFLSRIKKK